MAGLGRRNSSDKSATGKTPAAATLASAPVRGRRSATRRLFLKLCGTVLGAGIAGSVDAAAFEPHALDTTRHDASLPDLPRGLDGLKVVHLTDIHCGPITPDDVIDHALSVTAALEPDLVILTGDFVHSTPEEATRLAKKLAILKPRYGLWGCLGNHDYDYGPDGIANALTKNSAVRILRNESAEIVPGLHLAGIEDTYRGKPDTERALAGVPAGSALIFLTHNPTGVWGVTHRDCLALSGHTHGGQILVPGFPAPLPPGMEGFPLVAGWGVFEKARLYVSRGVGMGMAPVRFRCHPEVALHILRRGNDTPRQLPSLTDRALKRVMRIAAHAAHRQHVSTAQ